MPTMKKSQNQHHYPLLCTIFPPRIGIEIDIETVIKLAEIDNIVAIKESSGSWRALHLLQNTIQKFRGYLWL